MNHTICGRATFSALAQVVWSHGSATLSNTADDAVERACFRFLWCPAAFAARSGGKGRWDYPFQLAGDVKVRDVRNVGDDRRLFTVTMTDVPWIFLWSVDKFGSTYEFGGMPAGTQIAPARRSASNFRR